MMNDQEECKTSLEQIKDLKDTIKFLYQRIHRLEKENTHHVDALIRIESECSRDDSTAWSIASDALEISRWEE